MTDTAALFEPLLVKQVTLRNRIVMSPMTRRFSPGGVPTEEVANYYLRRVHGGVGLIITEGVGIDHPVALDDSGNPVMYGPDALAGWKRTVDVVHNEGGVIFPQLWHMGPMRKSGQGPVSQRPFDAALRFVGPGRRQCGVESGPGAGAEGRRTHLADESSRDRRGDRRLCTQRCLSQAGRFRRHRDSSICTKRWRRALPRQWISRP
jgi:hypothetical protein